MRPSPCEKCQGELRKLVRFLHPLPLRVIREGSILCSATVFFRKSQGNLRLSSGHGTHRVSRNPSKKNTEMRSVVLSSLVCLLGACATTPPDRYPAGARLSVSRGGRMYGMDSDAQITFADSQRIEVTEFGYSIETDKGSFFVDASSAIQVALRGYPAKWPRMYLYQDTKGAFLFPTDQNSSFRVGGRAGAVTSSRMAPYWPFRNTQS
jgi:hypothetical protein